MVLIDLVVGLFLFIWAVLVLFFFALGFLVLRFCDLIFASCVTDLCRRIGDAGFGETCYFGGSRGLI